MTTGIILPDPPPDTDHDEWCRRTFAMVRDGGVWAIPRSGLVFRKDAGARRFTLIARMPWAPELEGRITAEQLLEQQEAEYEATREAFEHAGIEVVKGENVSDDFRL